MTVFIQNKYTTIYLNIVHNALCRDSAGLFTEKHHIIPRCLGGRDTTDNLVSVTAREHYILHLLLIRMTVGQTKFKMINAAWWMCNPGKKIGRTYSIPSRLYESVRRANQERARISRQLHSHLYETDEYRAKISTSLKRIGHNHKTFLGKTHTEEAKKKISQANKGRGIGIQNSQYGTFWITNGIENKKVSKDSVIPDGWYKGRHYPQTV